MTPDEVDIMFVKEAGFLIGEQAVLDTWITGYCK
jgi:hypothetical protein